MFTRARLDCLCDRRSTRQARHARHRPKAPTVMPSEGEPLRGWRRLGGLTPPVGPSFAQAALDIRPSGRDIHLECSDECLRGGFDGGEQTRTLLGRSVCGRALQGLACVPQRHAAHRPCNGFQRVRGALERLRVAARERLAGFPHARGRIPLDAVRDVGKGHAKICPQPGQQRGVENGRSQVAGHRRQRTALDGKVNRLVEYPPQLDRVYRLREEVLQSGVETPLAVPVDYVHRERDDARSLAARPALADLAGRMEAVASDVKVFLGTPVLQAPPAQPRTGRPRTRPQLPADTHALYLVNLPPTASLTQWVQLAHQRRAIEQQYQELKRRTGPRSFRRPLAAGLGEARRVNGAGLCVAPTRARTPWRAFTHAAGRASGDHRYFSRLTSSSRIRTIGHHAETPRNSAADLKKLPPEGGRLRARLKVARAACER